MSVLELEERISGHIKENQCPSIHVVYFCVSVYISGWGREAGSSVESQSL